jgi:hypothetical protein
VFIINQDKRELRLSLEKVGQPNSSCLVVIRFERLIQITVNNVRHSSASSAIAD